MSRCLNRAVYSAAAAFLLILGLYYINGSTSICLSRLRVLSGTEILDAAITEELSPELQTASLYRIGQPQAQLLPYASFESFRAENSNCCEILTGWERGANQSMFGFLSRVLGESTHPVRLKYNSRYRTPDGKFSNLRIESLVFVSSCGQIILEPLRGG